MQTTVVQEEICAVPMMANLTGGHKVVHNIMTGTRLTTEFNVQPLQQVLSSGTGGFSVGFRYLNPYGHAVDPSLILHARVSFVLEGGANNASIDFKQAATRFAFAPNPLHRVMQNLSVRVNGSDIQTPPPYQIVSALHKYDDDLTYRAWLTSRQADSCNSQSLLKNYLAGAGKNVFNNCLEDSLETSRGGLIPECTVLQAFGASAKHQVKFTFNLYEVLKSPIFKRCDQAYDALHRVNEIDVNILFNDIRGMITSLLVYDSSGALCTIRNTSNSAATSDQTNLTGTDWLSIDALELLGRSYIPSIQVPSSFIKPIYDFDILPTPFTCSADGSTSVQVTVNNLNWSIVPERIYIYAIPTSNVGPNQADAFLCIDQVVINGGSDQGALSLSSSWQLYQMSCRNGLKGVTFNEFSNLQGSVIAISLAHGDLSGYIVGAAVKQQLSLRVTLRNTTSNDFGLPHNTLGSQGLSSFRGTYGSVVGITNWTLYVVAVRPGQLTLMDNMAQTQIGFDDSVLRGKDWSNPYSYAEYDVGKFNQFRGGAWYDGVKDFFTSVSKNPIVQGIAKTVAKTGIQMAQGMAQNAMTSGNPKLMALGTVATPLLGLAESQIGSGYRQPRRSRR